MFILYDAKLMILFYMTKYIMLLIVKMRYKISQKVLQKNPENIFWISARFLVRTVGNLIEINSCAEAMFRSDVTGTAQDGCWF